MEEQFELGPMHSSNKKLSLDVRTTVKIIQKATEITAASLKAPGEKCNNRIRSHPCVGREDVAHDSTPTGTNFSQQGGVGVRACDVTGVADR